MCRSVRDGCVDQSGLKIYQSEMEVYISVKVEV